MDSFIRGYENVLEPEVMERIVSAFEKISEQSGHNGKEQFGGKAGRHDRAIMLEDHSPELSGAIHKAIQPYLTDYLGDFPGTEDLEVIGYNVKLQKTEPTGGYHRWHCEQSGSPYAINRALVWILYLNDVAQGGETEFLNQMQRIQPKAGRLVIWPSAFPWLHRGNPPLEGTKYIATGWWFHNTANK